MDSDPTTPPLSDPSSLSSSPSSSSSDIIDDNLKSELGLDMAFPDSQGDPLEFLFNAIHAAPQDSSDSSASSQTDSPPHWTQQHSPSSSWTDSKFNDFAASDFNFNLPMDLDFDPNMAVDPSALHFNTSMFTQHAGLTVPSESMYLNPNDFVASSMFPFDSSSTPNAWAHQPTTPARRLSITSSSSSSGASLSPILEPSSTTGSSVASSASSDAGEPMSLGEVDPAAELAQRVRALAGVTLAVPVSAHVQQIAAAQLHSSTSSSQSATPTPPAAPVAVGGKLPIPRLPRSSYPTSALGTNIKSSPPPDPQLSASPTPSPDHSASSSNAASPSNLNTVDGIPIQTVVSPITGRPKTSHTTIERRYRTNLNARITGLKQAVPALRVLEQKKGGVGEGFKDVDVLDGRGFVDGVKVARKMSKANVLGKATEYIRVLKKRESRLKREQEGLRALIGGLVGGPALLKEWEREWRERFGGEERDEIEDEANGGNLSDDEDGDGEDSDDEDGGRARKKAKVTKKAPAAARSTQPPPTPIMPAGTPAMPPSGQPEKRKRGRPRKNPLPTSVPPPTVAAAAALPSPAVPPPVVAHHGHSFPMSMAQSQEQQQHHQPQQYLLAAFAFFSVFNSPLTSSYTRPHSAHGHSAHGHAHQHHGVVLTSSSPVNLSAIESQPVGTTVFGYGVHEIVQAFHLLVSMLVLVYVVLPWLRDLTRGKTSAVLSHISTLFSSSFPAAHSTKGTTTTTTTIKSNVNQKEALKDALMPARRGSLDEAETLREVLGVQTGLVGLVQGVVKAGKFGPGLEMNQLEQRAWVRLGELVAFNDSTPRMTRLQAYWCMSWHTSTFSASTTDLSTLALIIRPLSKSKAVVLWEQAQTRDILRPYEKIVLRNMSVDQAAEWLEKWRSYHEGSASRGGGKERKRCAACEKRTPLGVLAAILIRERLRKHAAAMFVRTVVPPHHHHSRSIPQQQPQEDSGFASATAEEYNPEKEMAEECERRETIEAGKSIGGRTAQLACLLERIWDTGFCHHEDVFPSPRPRHSHSHSASSASGDNQDADNDCEDEHDLASTDESEIRSLLSACLIYRRIFPSAFPTTSSISSSTPSSSPLVILSPPPSPSRKNVALHVALRSTLGSPAFDCASASAKAGRLDPELGAALEDARDRVVDMLVELDFAGRRNGRF